MKKEEAIQKMINEKRWRLPDDVFSDAGYVSPIKQIVSDWQMTMEENVMKAVRQVDIHVDKEELIKALQYDRKQYEKGCSDTQRVLKPMCKHFCKVMSQTEISREYHDWCSLYQEDCHCQCCYGGENNETN